MLRNEELEKLRKDFNEKLKKLRKTSLEERQRILEENNLRAYQENLEIYQEALQRIEDDFVKQFYASVEALTIHEEKEKPKLASFLQNANYDDVDVDDALERIDERRDLKQLLPTIEVQQQKLLDEITKIESNFTQLLSSQNEQEKKIFRRITQENVWDDISKKRIELGGNGLISDLSSQVQTYQDKVKRYQKDLSELATRPLRRRVKAVPPVQPQAKPLTIRERIARGLKVLTYKKRRKATLARALLYIGAGVGIGITIGAAVATGGIALGVAAAVVGVIGFSVAITKSYRANKEEMTLEEKNIEAKEENKKKQAKVIRRLKQQYVKLEADFLKSENETQKNRVKRHAKTLRELVKDVKTTDETDLERLQDLDKRLTGMIGDNQAPITTADVKPAVEIKKVTWKEKLRRIFSPTGIWDMLGYASGGVTIATVPAVQAGAISFGATIGLSAVATTAIVTGGLGLAGAVVAAGGDRIISKAQDDNIAFLKDSNDQMDKYKQKQATIIQKVATLNETMLKEENQGLVALTEEKRNEERRKSEESLRMSVEKHEETSSMISSMQKELEQYGVKHKEAMGLYTKEIEEHQVTKEELVQTKQKAEQLQQQKIKAETELEQLRREKREREERKKLKEQKRNQETSSTSILMEMAHGDTHLAQQMAEEESHHKNEEKPPLDQKKVPVNDLQHREDQQQKKELSTETDNENEKKKNPETSPHFGAKT